MMMPVEDVAVAAVRTVVHGPSIQPVISDRSPVYRMLIGGRSLACLLAGDCLARRSPALSLRFADYRFSTCLYVCLSCLLPSFCFVPFHSVVCSPSSAGLLLDASSSSFLPPLPSPFPSLRPLVYLRCCFCYSIADVCHHHRSCCRRCGDRSCSRGGESRLAIAIASAAAAAIQLHYCY